MNAYEFKPEAINSLTPAPRYIDKSLTNTSVGRPKDDQYNLERYRTSTLQRRANDARFYRGRLYSHIKLEQIKSNVEEVRDKMVQKAKRKQRKSNKNNQTYEKYEIDDQLSLPMGTDYDFIIKKKAEEIDNQKLQNNKKMDELIEQLGYMDYRDALACNKYIMEAKRSGEYH